METILAALISSLATILVAFLHRKKYFNKKDEIVEDLKARLSIKDSNVIIISKIEDVPRRLLKSDGNAESPRKQPSKIIVVK